MKSYTIVCKNCNTKVAKTPNKQCVNCKMPNFGYTQDELNKINSPNKAPIHSLVCKNCNQKVAKTPNNICVSCGLPKWGYSDFALENGLVESTLKPIVVKPGIVTNPTGGISTSGMNIKSTSNLLLYGLIAGVVLLGIFGMFSLSNNNTGDISQEAETESEEGIIDDTEEVRDVAQSMEELKAAIVKISTPGGGIGTGFLISPTKILTAAHVAYGNDNLKVEFTGLRPQQKKTAQVIKIGNVKDVRGLSFFLHDFALLKISKIRDVKPIALGSSDDVIVLSEVMTIGHSQGDAEVSVTDGKINSRKFGEGRVDLFKHNIPSNPGNSGGPIILKDTKEVIAIIVGGRGISKSGGQVNIPQGENIGVKIDNIKRELDNFDLTK